jgi:hypothetical protein
MTNAGAVEGREGAPEVQSKGGNEYEGGLCATPERALALLFGSPQRRLRVASESDQAQARGQGYINIGQTMVTVLCEPSCVTDSA